MAYLTMFAYKRAFSISVAVLLALIVNHFISFSHEYWLFLSAFLVAQATRGARLSLSGAPLKQGLIYFLIIVAALVVSALLLMNIQEWDVRYFVLSAFFVICSYMALTKFSSTNSFVFYLLVFALLLVLASTAPHHAGDFMKNRTLDVVFGSVIGLVCAALIFPPQWESRFRVGVAPLFQALIDATSHLEHIFLKRTQAEPTSYSVLQVYEKNIHLYPEWAYEVGFNRGLRAGFRFFLMHVERLTDLFFSMEYWAHEPMQEDLLQAVAAPISHALAKNRELLIILRDYFANQKKPDTTSDFTGDITELEGALQSLVPQLELMSASSEYTTLIAFVSDIKDVRKILLQLVMSLPA